MADLDLEIDEKPVLLYVDDEEDNLVVFKSAFRRHFKVLTAISAEDGLNVLKDEPVSIIITDQRMPNMTGVEFLKHLPEGIESISMILTGFSDVQAIIDAINTGQVYRYITKPWDKDELKITLDKALETLLLRQRNKKLIKELQEANEGLEKKVKERTAEVERLLHNILPEEVATELREHGKASPKHYNKVSVLFADFKHFTQLAEKLTPEQLVALLDEYFNAFDAVLDKYNIEKIKTLGDGYMAAGGLPIPNETNPVDTIKAALEIQAFVKSKAEAARASGLPALELRIGVHTGTVVAGVVGSKKFAYDIWGDAVNTASRLEGSGEVGKVNISGTTYELVKDQFTCTYRGKVQAKNKGEIDMYFVEG